MISLSAKQTNQPEEDVKQFSSGHTHNDVIFILTESGTILNPFDQQ